MDENKRLHLFYAEVCHADGYDALGRRASKTVNGVRTYYISLGDQEIAEYDNSGNPFRRYVDGAGLDEPLALISTNGQRSYHLTDALGSVIGLLDNSSSLTERHAYTAYGISLGSSATPYQYAGRRLDEETGLYHNRARAYSPTLGRFLQADPIGTEGGINLYGYVGNDPLNLTDPMGLKLRYAEGTTEQDKKDFAAAIKYLNNGKVSSVIARLESRPEIILINTHAKDGDQYQDGVIGWDPRSALRTTKGGKQTPALGFLHEAEHAYGDLTGTGSSPIPNGTPYYSAEEQRVIDKYETPAAIKLNEGTRTDHFGEAYPTNCSTCTGRSSGGSGK